MWSLHLMSGPMGSARPDYLMGSLRACIARSGDEELRWQFYMEWREKNADVLVVPAGPMLPPNILEARVNEGQDIPPVDLGVVHDPSWIITELEPEVCAADPCPLDTPSSVLVREKPNGPAAVVRPFFFPSCAAHESCNVAGVAYDFKGSTYAGVLCGQGRADDKPLPPYLRKRLKLDIPPDLSRVVNWAKRNPLLRGAVAATQVNQSKVFLYRGILRDPGGGLHPDVVAHFDLCHSRVAPPDDWGVGRWGMGKGNEPPWDSGRESVTFGEACSRAVGGHNLFHKYALGSILNRLGDL